MPSSRHCRACAALLELSGTAPLADVRADLEAVETLIHEIDDLTALLRVHLPPEQFKLVWCLRDAVERLGIAEDILRERQRPADVVGQFSRCAHSR